MPRLTNPDYVRIHHKLRTYWQEEASPFGYLAPAEQWDLHKYFQPSHELSDQALLAHRKAISALDSSLPQRAGRALQRLERAIHQVSARQAMATTLPTKRKRSGDVRVRAVMLPEPDYHKIARAMLWLAREGKT